MKRTGGKGNSDDPGALLGAGEEKPTKRVGTEKGLIVV